MTAERCEWAGSEGGKSSLMIEYHDEEWGEPVHDDRLLLEFLILEGAQAGLSWSTVLNKRQRYREVFNGFDPAKVALFDEVKVAQLLDDPGIIRNRLKVRSAISNAQLFLKIQAQHGSFDEYIWQFVDGEPKINRWQCLADMPATTVESDAMSRTLKKVGFRFVGSTICYAFMQATGMVNDHTVDCFRYRELGGR
jgi:DNA-3-methyladenine glycosylase I